MRHDDEWRDRRTLIRLILFLAAVGALAAMLSGCSVMRCHCEEGDARTTKWPSAQRP